MSVLKEIPLTDVGGFRIGNAQDTEVATGCTVILFDELSPVGIDIRGGGPASRETPLLDPRMATRGLHAVLLSGGSAYGLDAAGGVMRYLEERGIGFSVGPTVVPLVCQSDIFDLGIGRFDVRPDGAMAYQACKAASYDMPVLGNAGVGMGCTVGKVMGMQHAMKSGLGAYAVSCGDVRVGALVAVNALGNVYDPDTGKCLAGVTDDMCRFVSAEEKLWELQTGEPDTVTNTTIGIVFTNCSFAKGELGKIASMAQNGYARTIRPVHTMNDGDTIYAASVGAVKSDTDIVGTLAAHVMARAVVSAVMSAEPVFGFKCARNMVNMEATV